MAEDVLKGVVDAIADSDNLIGGMLMTRLRRAHIPGLDNALLRVASPTQLTSLVNVFDDAHVGRLVDIVAKGTPTGNQGSYRIASLTDAKNVTLETITGGTPSFVDEDDVRWRFADLPVETVLHFPKNDVSMALWVGEEPTAIPYLAVQLVPADQWFLGLGESEGRDDGIIDPASPQKLVSVAPVFEASHVGAAIYVLPSDPADGNEGARIIASVDDANTVTLTGDAFVAENVAARWRVKTYSGNGYPILDHRSGAEVIDASRSFSAMDQLWRSLTTTYADGDELDRVGRMHAVIRPRGLPDTTYREVARTMAYMPKQTLYALELLLDALYPGGGWAIAEDLEGRPAEVFVQMPGLAATEEIEGRGFLSGSEAQTSDTATQVTTTYDPISVLSVVAAPRTDSLDMTVLPSAASPAWSFVAESAGTEGTYFSTVTGGLQQSAAGGTDNGRYVLSMPEVDGAFVEVSALWSVSAAPTTGGLPWKIIVRDGEREYALVWDETNLYLGQADETTVSAAAAVMSAAAQHHLRLVRRGDVVEAWVDHRRVHAEPASSFAASSATEASFGYTDQGNAQTWTATWRALRVSTRPSRNFWNISRDDGVLANPGAFSSAAGLFQAGDDGKLIRTHSDQAENDGLWEAAYVSATQLTLSGVRRQGASADGEIVTLDERWFDEHTTDKTLRLVGSALDNNGDYPILAWGGDSNLTGSDASLTPYQVRVDASGHPNASLSNEDALAWEFVPDFASESSVPWELVDAGSTVDNVLTLRETLPAANTDVFVHYTPVLSAQILENEFVKNEGTAGTVPNIYYPLYLLDIDRITRTLVEQVTAAGVIPVFEIPTE